MQPNWPSEDDPDYTPEFGDGSGEIDFADPSENDIDELREELEDLVDDDS